MSLEDNKAIARKVTEAENNRDLTVIEKLISPTYINQSLQMNGPEGYKQFLTKLFKAFPNWHETIEDIIAEGDKVCIRLKIDTGTHTGEFDLLGIKIAPTGKRSTVKSIQIWRIVNGKVVEQEGVYDELDLFRQVGLIVPTEEGKKLFPEDVK
jgi:predicted ester cyclase